MAQVTVRLDNGLRTTITARNQTWYADEPVEDGGSDTGPKSTEMLLGSLGACMAMTAKMYALRKKWPLERVEVALEMERFNASDYPAYAGDALYVYEIREQIVFHGPLTDEQKARLREIAGKCPVRRVLSNPVFFVE